MPNFNYEKDYVKINQEYKNEMIFKLEFILKIRKIN